MTDELTEPKVTHVMPDDWSVIQLSSSGSYNKKAFQVIGRIRIQLQQDYKNFWCIWYEETKSYEWIAESNGNYQLFKNEFFDIRDYDQISTINAGHKFIIHDQITVTTRHVDYCTWESLEGELCQWPSRTKGFTYIDASNNDRIAVCFILSPYDRIGKYLIGEVIDFNSLNLKSIREWDEWK